jgi:energy-coupling factor transport system ATP-binding protein
MIRVRNLCFSYPGQPLALAGIDLDIAAGASLAVVGANGSGKTTLARCLNGLHLPTRGDIEVDGWSVSDPLALPAIRQRVGMVFQNPDDQLVATTVEDEIAFGLENLAVPTAEIRARVDQVLAAFHLTEYRRHPPHRLSGGEKQRLAVAAAVALRPGYLVLDEPTALLDPRSRREVIDLVRGLRQQAGVATIHITHAADEALDADRLVVLDQGRVVMDDAPARVFADPGPLLALGLGVPFASAVAARLDLSGALLDGEFPRTPAALAARLAPWARAAVGRAAWAPEPPAASTPIKLAAEQLTYTYDPGLPTAHVGLAGAELNVPVGAIVALIGPSGSGKTTLAQHLNALLHPDAGRILLDGADLWSLPLPRVRQRVGLVFQFPELQLFEETVWQDVGFGPRNLGYGRERVDALVAAALDLVGLPAARFAARSPLALSGGEKRRAAIAGVLAMDPEVLVLDEPTAGLDASAARSLTCLLRRLHAAGKTLVLITHDMDLVATLASHVAVMHRGRVQCFGPVRQVLTDPEFATASGLEAPAPVQLASAWRELGIPITAPALSLEELAQVLTPALSAAAPGNEGGTR